jgi:hypothetical protein
MKKETKNAAYIDGAHITDQRAVLQAKFEVQKRKSPR